MSPYIPSGWLVIPAVLGAMALLVRLGAAALRLAFAAAQATAMEGMAEISARRGDLTLLAERREQARSVARSRRAELLRALLWGALLVLPPLLGWAVPIYSAAALLWLMPRRPLRPVLTESRSPR